MTLLRYGKTNKPASDRIDTMITARHPYPYPEMKCQESLIIIYKVETNSRIHSLWHIHTTLYNNLSESFLDDRIFINIFIVISLTQNVERC